MKTNREPDGLVVRVAAAFDAYRAGEPAQMGVIVEATTPILWHTARAQGLDHARAEDVVQTAFLRLVEQCETIRDSHRVLGWLLVTVKRESWRVAKGARRDAFEIDTETPTLAAGPEDVVLRNDRHRVLWRHLTSLSSTCQALLRVIAFADRPDYAAVSEALRMPVGSIGPTRGRCLSKLRSLLQSDPAWGGA